VVLGRLRHRGEVSCPTVATITDLTGLFFWAQPGIDMHLAMYADSLEAVRRIAGDNSVELVRPLISAEFLRPRCPAQTRRALGLPEHGRMIVVSGGGWGVGDLEGAVSELCGIEDATSIVCLTGRNQALQQRLGMAFAAEPRVHVYGFTERMPELLAAADALVHSTGGVTCLEAMATGTPVISYGLPVGHARINTQAMAELDLVRLARNTRELREQVEASFVPVAVLDGETQPAAGVSSAVATTSRVVTTSTVESSLRSAVDVVMAAPRRVRAIPSWRPRLVQVAVQLTLVLAIGGWTMSTDELNALASSVFRIHPLTHVITKAHSVALIIRAPEADVAAVATALAADGVHATFAETAPAPSARTVSALRTFADEGLPAVQRGGLLRWVLVPHLLHEQAHAYGLHRHYYFLQSGPPTVGALMLARTTGATPVTGDWQLNARRPFAHGRIRAGDVVVLTLDGSEASVLGAERLVSSLRKEGLGAE